VGTFESDFIGDVDHTADDFKTLLNHLGDVAATLPPSQIPKLDDLPALFGSLVAFLEHGDSVISAAASSAIHTAATLGRQDVAQISAAVETAIKLKFAALQAEAAAAGVALPAAAAPDPAPPAAPDLANQAPPQ
jgi:hypothetical protein